MKISEQWLREWVSPELSTQELAHQLTMAGLEVDAIDPVAGVFSGVVVAEIISAEQHPDADKLRVCQVNTGAETVQIVFVVETHFTDNPLALLAGRVNDFPTLSDVATDPTDCFARVT